MSSVLETALDLAARGVPCFPCNAKKEPTCPQGFKAAATDAGTLRYLWGRYPGALIGVPTGGKFVVIDFDFAKYPEAKIFHDKIELPVTRIHGTGSGGLHYLFQPNAAIRCTTSKIHSGVDSRGNGGYIIWWPHQGLEVFNPAALAPVPDVFIAAPVCRFASNRGADSCPAQCPAGRTQRPRFLGGMPPRRTRRP
jgi:hypothetical protein